MQQPPSQTKTDALKISANLIGATCLLYVSLSWCLRAGFGALLNAVSNQQPATWALWLCNLGIAVVCLLVAYKILVLLTPKALQVTISFMPVKNKRLFLFLPVFLGIVMIANVIGSIVSGLLQKVSAYTPPQKVELPQEAFALFLCFLTMCVVPAVLEEVLVRGVMQPMLMRWGVWFGIVVSSVAFTLLHSDIGQMPSVFVLSVTLGLVAYCTRSLTAGIVLHFLNNVISFVLLYMGQNLQANSQIAFGAFLIGILFFAGVVCIVFIYRLKLYKMFAPVPKFHANKNRQARTVRLAKSPVYIVAMLLLAIKAFLPLLVQA